MLASRLVVSELHPITSRHSAHVTSVRGTQRVNQRAWMDPRAQETGAASGGPHKSNRLLLSYALAVAGSSTRRGSKVSRAITSRWICAVPS